MVYERKTTIVHSHEPFSINLESLFADFELARLHSRSPYLINFFFNTELVLQQNCVTLDCGRRWSPYHLVILYCKYLPTPDLPHKKLYLPLFEQPCPGVSVHLSNVSIGARKTTTVSHLNLISIYCRLLVTTKKHYSKSITIAFQKTFWKSE